MLFIVRALVSDLPPASAGSLRGPWLPAVAGLFLVGCTPKYIVIHADEAVMSARFYPSSTRLTPLPSGQSRSRSHQILILTSGGADGAFGAGVLNAWSGSGRRPNFDVVAGVSTGALQATAAFLGKNYDHWLKEVYTTTRTRDVFSSNGLRAFTGPGLYDPSPLRELLRKFITEELLDEVAVAHRSGRRLYVATTDVTLGKAVFWDMGAIAAAGGNRRNHYVDILIASTAVPGLIEPVRVMDHNTGDSSLHGDGALKTPVPLEAFMLPLGNRERTRVWVIANGHISRNTALRSEAKTTLPLARRAVTQIIRQLLYSSSREAEAVSLRAGARFQLISLPETTPESLNPFEFKPAEMEKLYEAGFILGAQTFGTAVGRPDGPSRGTNP